MKKSEDLIGKTILVSADHRISSRNRLVVNGMALNVIGVDEHAIYARPLPKEFSHKTVELPFHQDILWSIEEVLY